MATGKAFSQPPLPSTLLGPPTLTHPPNTQPLVAPLDPALKTQIEAIVEQRVKVIEEAKKSAEEAKRKDETEQGVVVGNAKGNWLSTWRNGLWFESANKDYTFHLGGTVQYDLGFYSPQNTLVNGPRSIGIVEDGANLRRGRLRAEGAVWEVIDYRFELEFFNAITPAGSPTPGASRAGEGQTVMTTGPTDAWFTIKELPFVGNFRIGNQKEPIGLDHLESFRFLPFMERSPLFDFNTATAFNNGFSPGILLFDTLFDQRMTWALGAFKNSYQVGGFSVADGAFAATGRVTALPCYEDEGMYLVHLGFAASHRDPEFQQDRYRIRPSIRSAPGPVTTLIPVLTDTGFLNMTSQDIVAVEAFANIGPLSLQAEYMAFRNSNVALVGGPSVGTTFYQGYYAQALYWLTGEYTRWDKKAAAPDRYVVNRPFFLIKGASGIVGNPGAWQVGVRWSQVDSNDRGVNGGMLDDLTIGINWILNPNVKLQWNYEWARRYGLGPANDGNFHGVGMRAQFDF